MTGTAIPLASGTDWSARGARWFIVAVAVTTIAIGPPSLLTVFGSPVTPPLGHAAVVFPLALGILALQLRHSFAIARGERPRGVLWTLLAQAVLIYVPLHWFGWSPYWSARLARLLSELRETRAELAALAVGRERLRVSRDLHDLLGQSLSAVALKGDLAIRLLHNDPPAARAEIESLTGLARDAIRGIHTVSRDEHAVSLRIETEGAATLLSAAGIRCRIDVDLPDLAPPVERVLAWTVREGVTNALRHSEAHTCSITGGRRDGNVILEIVNDGAPATPGEGSGLSGLTERARALSGSVAAGRTADGEFRLLVEVPEGARM